MADDAPRLRGELRRLSSLRGQVAELLFVALASACTVGALVVLFLGNGGVFLMLLAFSIGIWIAVAAGGPSLVETDGHWLLVSDLRKTVWIPLGQVVSVEQGWFPGATRVHVQLACDTPFGREIVFGLSVLVDPHAVVEELRALAARARAAQSRSGSNTASVLRGPRLGPADEAGCGGWSFAPVWRRPDGCRSWSARSCRAGASRSRAASA